MKSLLATVGALALMVSATACDTGAETAGPIAADGASTRADTMTVPAPERTDYLLAAGEIEASDLIGAAVHDMAGATIATVADIHLAGAGTPAMLILRDGGVAGVGGEMRSAAFTAAAITAAAATAGDEPVVTLKLTETTLETLPKFEQDAPDDRSLASEMIGTNLDVSFNDDTARINDLILSGTGETRYAVIAEDLVSAAQILVDTGDIVIAEGDTDGGLTLNMTAVAFAAAPSYPRE